MPLYEYACKDCDHHFSKVLTLHEYDEDHVSCPKCGSKNTEQLVSAFFAVTSKKS